MEGSAVAAVAGRSCSCAPAKAYPTLYRCSDQRSAPDGSVEHSTSVPSSDPRVWQRTRSPGLFLMESVSRSMLGAVRGARRAGRTPSVSGAAHPRYRGQPVADLHRRCTCQTGRSHVPSLSPDFSGHPSISPDFPPERPRLPKSQVIASMPHNQSGPIDRKGESMPKLLAIRTARLFALGAASDDLLWRQRPIRGPSLARPGAPQRRQCQCSDDALSTLWLPDTVITAAFLVPAQGSGAPAFCKVLDTVAPETDIEVRLPDNWHGHLLHLGGSRI